MTTPPPTPAPEPTTAEVVAGRYLTIDPTDTETLRKLGDDVAAANAVVRRLHNRQPDGTWKDDHAAGAAMLAARLWKRRKTVEGLVTNATPEGGAIYVARTDPEIAMLLELGVWARPVVG